MILLSICCEMWRWLVKMARRSFKLLKNLETNFESASQNHAVSEKATDVEWSVCFIFQEDLKDKLVCPLNGNRKWSIKNNIQTLLTISGGFKM